MKIALNLAVSPSWRERYALAWSLATMLVVLLVMLGFIHSMFEEFRAYRKLEGDLAAPQRQEAELARREAELRRHLERPEFRGTLREAQYVNSLIDRKRLSLASLAVEVIDLLPQEARLSGLALTRANNDSLVRFQVNSKTEKGLETFVSNLSSSPDFAEPAVATVGLEPGGQAAGEMTVTCTARYVGAREDTAASTGKGR